MLFALSCGLLAFFSTFVSSSSSSYIFFFIIKNHFKKDICPVKEFDFKMIDAKMNNVQANMKGAIPALYHQEKYMYTPSSGLAVKLGAIDSKITDSLINGWNYLRDNASASINKEINRSPDGVVAKAVDTYKNLKSDMLNGNSDSVSTGVSGLGASYSSSRSSSTSAKQLDYLNADLAQYYGMDKKAAYSEALQNTAYQRAVADLKAAGLNPVLAAGQVSPAGSFAAGNTLSGGAGSGASGGAHSGTSGKYALSSDHYNMLGVVGAALGAMVGSKTTPNSPMLGASSGAMLGKQLFQQSAQFMTGLMRQ